jgi:membrane glycosyltransferase
MATSRTFPGGAPLWTASMLARRRAAFLFMVAATVLCLAGWLAFIVSGGVNAALASLMVGAFALKATWVAIMFWQAAIGFVLLLTSPDRGSPFAGHGSGRQPIDARVAVVMTVCDEDAEAMTTRLAAIKASLDATAERAAFHYFLLSDSSDAGIIAAEQASFAAWRSLAGGEGALFYRRRAANSGAQHGNLRDFCERWGADYDIMLVLDADSLMTAQTILHLLRIMQAHPRIGILQSLCVGILPPGLFARIFEFGHRHAMRCWIVGAVWWQGERGQYRGHNAAIRIAPYLEHCDLAALSDREPFGGIMFCHDQIESALMHRAGWQVWELPEEGGSYEGLPPSMLDSITRYNRWLQGNLKNLKILRLPGLRAMDRYHLIAVAHRFIAWPAVVAFALLAEAAAILWPPGVAFPRTSALALLATYFGLYFAPRLLGVLEAALRDPSSYGGIARLLSGAAAEAILTVLFAPVAMVAATGALGRLATGRRLGWETQRRAFHRIGWIEAARALWPQSLIGAAMLAVLLLKAAGAAAWFLPFCAGLLLSVPLAVATSSRTLSVWAERWKFCAGPEEIDIPTTVARVGGQDIARSPAMERSL